jgi:hypothetical protein
MKNVTNKAQITKTALQLDVLCVYSFPAHNGYEAKKYLVMAGRGGYRHIKIEGVKTTVMGIYTSLAALKADMGDIYHY